MSNRSDYESYMLIKTIIYLSAGFLALFIATCSGGCTLEAVATGEHKDLSYMAWAIVFGFVAFFCLRGFRHSKNILERALQGLPLTEEKEEKDEEAESE